MKKIVIILTLIISLAALNKHNQLMIPEESIRFRIVANSNLEEDQQIKQEIAQKVFEVLKPTQEFTNIEETRNYIQKQLPTFSDIVEKVLLENNLDKSFHINYGKNKFPEKEYKNITYAEGDYESLVITLGKGEGDNFWCVLFPPICLIEEDENIEYKSFLKELIEKYF